MPNMKSQRRSLTRELKYTGLPLPIRARLAKLSIRGDGYLITDTLRSSGATVVKSWGCECCDPHSSALWEYRGKHFRTEFGQLDRRLTEMAQQRQKDAKAPGVPLGQLLASRTEAKPAPPIDPMKDLKEVREEIKKARRALDDLVSKETRISGDLLLGAIGDKSPSCLEHGDWDCNDSPTGRCVYNHDEDPIHDLCLFCGDPEERK